MNDLRLVLLGLGVLLIAVIWLVSLYLRRRSAASRAEPHGEQPRRRGGAAGEASRKSSASQRLRGDETPPLGLDFPGADGDGEGGIRASGGGARPAPGGAEESAGRGWGQDSDPFASILGGDASPELAGDPEPAPAGSGRPAESLAGLRATHDEGEALDIDAVAEEDEEDGDAPSEDDEPPAETLVVILTVLAPKGEKLEGAALRSALEAQGLRLGPDRVFHRYPDAAPAGAGPLFSAVNIVEPGVFDLETMDSMHTPGVGLFMRLPGPKDPGDAFSKMVESARQLAATLEAQLCDETRSKLTAQALNHLREQIADFGRRRLLRV